MDTSNTESLIARIEQLEKNSLELVDTHNNLANLTVQTITEFRLWLQAVPWAMSQLFPENCKTSTGEPLNIYEWFNTEVVQRAKAEAKNAQDVVEYAMKEAEEKL